MWPTSVAGVWLTLSSIWDWMCMLYLYFVDKCKVFIRRNHGDVVDQAPSETTKVAVDAISRDKYEKYDVFVNHRGPDVKLTFAAHLNDALRRAGFRPFLDAKSIREGSHVFKSIDEGLNVANVHVAIFSKGYAESKYCLEELCAMLQSHRECQKVIIPVFYDVNPEDLRYVERGPYAKGFRKHQSRNPQKDIQKWKDALIQVAEFRGFRKDEVSGDENELVKRIVAAVERALPVNLHLSQSSPKFGLAESLQDVVDTLTLMRPENVGILGLVGMGGIGKTSLAWEIYNHYISRREFRYHSFLKDVRSTSQLELQQQLVSDLLKQEMKGSSDKYQHWFESFRSHKMLVVIDDIDTTSQFEALIPDILGLAVGSRIVVTSRHRDVVNLAMRPATKREIYEVKELNPMDSRRLFNWHAFYSEEVPSHGNFPNLATQVADACGGHPLALEVIGRSMSDKTNLGDERIWTDAVKTLKENSDIIDKLKISYTGLPSDGERAMFRDIACLMIGMRKDVAMELWNSCHSCGEFCTTTKGPSQALRRLEDKSLVRLDAGLRLVMHDVIRDMGRDVVIKESREPWQRTHLWDAATTAKLMSKNLGRCSRIRGIKLSTMESKRTSSDKAEKFENLDELHLLILDGCLLTEKESSKLSEELRWLQWRSFPGTQLPSGLDLPNLVVLDLSSSNLSCLWQESIHLEFPALQRLILTNCRELQELPQNIGHSLPRLRTIEMENCSLIVALPGSIGQLKDLEQLILSGCESLESLPDAVVNLAQLKRLMLRDCRKLKQLPMDLGRLINLEVLGLSNCSGLIQLPPSIKGLRMLKELHMVSACNPDGQLLTYVGALSALTALHLCQNHAITVLPQTFGDMKFLLHLQISFCPALQIVEALPRSLHCLDMANCPQLSGFPSIAEVSSLMSLNLCNCKSLTQIGGLECLTALEEINIAGCTSLLRTELQILHPSRSLRMCYLSGSKVAFLYDNKWSEAEPAHQLISYYDDSIGYIPNGMTQKLIAREWSYEFAAETTILSETKCLAVIFCFVVHDQGFSDYPWGHGHYGGHCYMDVWIMREGMRLYDSRLFTVRHADEGNQVYLCTFRRKHPFVQILRVGDKICLYARSQYPGWKITVQEGAICVVHEDHEHQAAIATNSKPLIKGHSIDLVENFNNLVLVDHCSLSLESKFGKIESSEESKDVLDSLSIDTHNPDTLEEWLIEPAYGLYSWVHSWKLPREGQGIISFVAQGTNDIHMAISEQLHSRHPMYEIVIGGRMNTATAIRRTRGDIEVTCVAAGLINPGAPNRLWVSIDARTSMIQVGRGEPSQDVIAIYRDTGFYSGVRHVSFTTNDTQITYSNVVIADLEQPTPVLDTYELSEKVYKQVLNDAWAIVRPVHGHYSWAQYWLLPSPGRGILSFTVEGSVDIHVAISARPHDMNPMYEINFGNWDNNRTLIRRNVMGPLGPIQCGVEYGGMVSVNHLWVLLDARSGIIQLGRGEPGQNMYCIYKDPAFLSEAQYFSFSTLHSPATFSNVAVTQILE
ncbi:hypothetical protein M758_2G223400 [Ceratodon purpureus]|nr:hypothetical protein M758_2G223400 [Ceratodon purpureus]